MGARACCARCKPQHDLPWNTLVHEGLKLYLLLFSAVVGINIFPGTSIDSIIHKSLSGGALTKGLTQAFGEARYVGASWSLTAKDFTSGTAIVISIFAPLNTGLNLFNAEMMTQLQKVVSPKVVMTILPGTDFLFILIALPIWATIVSGFYSALASGCSCRKRSGSAVLTTYNDAV